MWSWYTANRRTHKQEFDSATNIRISLPENFKVTFGKDKEISAENVEKDKENDGDQKWFLRFDEEEEDVYLEEFMIVLDNVILKI